MTQVFVKKVDVNTTVVHQGAVKCQICHYISVCSFILCYRVTICDFLATKAHAYCFIC